MACKLKSTRKAPEHIFVCLFQYANPQALLSDFELMFNNARRYNEEGSLVYNDANTLEKALKLKWKNICQTNDARKALSKRLVLLYHYVP